MDITLAAYNPSELSRMLNQVGSHLGSLSLGVANAFEKGNLMQLSQDEKSQLIQFGQTEFRWPRKMLKLRKYNNRIIDLIPLGDLLQDVERIPALKTLVIGTPFYGLRRTDEILERFFSEENILRSVENLTLQEMHDPKLLAGLKTALPNLVRLELDTMDAKDGGEVSGMKLGVVLKACGGWRGLRHLKLKLPTF